MPAGKILAYVIGDVNPCAEWVYIAANCIDVFNTENAGVYALNIDNTARDKRNTYQST